jgi:DNA polymerase-3 subunit epsilon
MGDAKATAELFHQLVAADEGNYIQKSLNPQSKEQTLPPNISKQQFDALPEETGVYYFYNAINKIVYIGKAVNIKKRVSQHFTKDLKSNQRQSFMRDIHGIGHEITGNELMALLHESSEIQKHWPMYNRALKRLNFRYGIFSYTGNDGYTRIGVDRLRKNARPLQVYDHLSDGFQALQQLLNQYSLCANKCIFQQHDAIEPCGDSCSCKQGTEVYNSQVSEALDWLKNAYENYYIYGKGRHEGESSVVSVKQGSYSAYGYITEEINMHVPLEDQLKPAPVNTAAMSIIQSFVEHPQYRIVRYA